jgi:8-oxo-dGTP diphosphatase
MGAAAVVPDNQGRVLLVKHGYGRLNWELPGGAAEEGESIVETVLREVREEMGLSVEAERMTGVYYDPARDAHHFVFLCCPLDETREPRPDGEEITAASYYHPDSLPRPISDFTVRRIEDALSGPAGPLPVTIPPLRWLE